MAWGIAFKMIFSRDTSTPFLPDDGEGSEGLLAYHGDMI